MVKINAFYNMSILKNKRLLHNLNKSRNLSLIVKNGTVVQQRGKI